MNWGRGVWVVGRVVDAASAGVTERGAGGFLPAQEGRGGGAGMTEGEAESEGEGGAEARERGRRGDGEGVRE